LRYKRVDPDYQSLGAIFLTNDVEEISLGSQLASRGGRISLALSAGAQRNNLDGRQALTSARLIGSANLAWQPAERVSLGFSYSNFSANSSARRDAFTD